MHKIKRLGHRQSSIVQFGVKYPGWHTYAKHTKLVIFSLEKLGLIDHSLQTAQFRIKS